MGFNKFFILVYVNDILIIGDLVVKLNTTIKNLRHEFPMKDLVIYHSFLELTLNVQSMDFSLTNKYIWDLLEQAGMADAKRYSTPMSVTLPLTKSNGQPLLDGSMYRRIFGAL